MKRSCTALIMAFIFMACNQFEVVKAKIFERKNLPQKHLRIKYQYVINNRAYTDSAVVEDVVINGDTINVKADILHPYTSTPVLTK